jgi:hypothetical protein
MTGTHDPNDVEGMNLFDFDGHSRVVIDINLDDDGRPVIAIAAENGFRNQNAQEHLIFLTWLVHEVTHWVATGNVPMGLIMRMMEDLRAGDFCFCSPQTPEVGTNLDEMHPMARAILRGEQNEDVQVPEEFDNFIKDLFGRKADDSHGDGDKDAPTEPPPYNPFE